ncbi:MAG: YhjD/YihY/BrkB family envelope integrity protein [Candidatus Nanopelagicales bacterium]
MPSRPDHQGLGQRLARTASTTSAHLVTRTQAARDRHASFDRVFRATARYHRRSVGRQATVITYAAYFLAFPLLVIYLLVLSWLFHSSPRSNDFMVAILELPAGTDLGDLLSSTYSTSFDAFVGLVGGVGVVLAAAATASDFRAGVDMVFGLTSPRRSLLRAPALDFSAGIWLAVCVLLSWLLSLGLVVRRGTITDLTGERFPWLLVLALKVGSLALTVLLVALMVDLSLRRVRDRMDRRTRIVGALLLAVFAVGGNFTLLYFMLQILADPDGGGGFAVAILLLLWVSVAVRGVMFALCWMSVNVPDTDTDTDTEPEVAAPVSENDPDRTLTDP